MLGEQWLTAEGPIWPPGGSILLRYPDDENHNQSFPGPPFAVLREMFAVLRRARDALSDEHRNTYTQTKGFQSAGRTLVSGDP